MIRAGHAAISSMRRERHARVRSGRHPPPSRDHLAPRRRRTPPGCRHHVVADRARVGSLPDRQPHRGGDHRGHRPAGACGRRGPRAAPRTGADHGPQRQWSARGAGSRRAHRRGRSHREPVATRTGLRHCRAWRDRAAPARSHRAAGARLRNAGALHAGAHHRPPRLDPGRAERASLRGSREGADARIGWARRRGTARSGRSGADRARRRPSSSRGELRGAARAPERRGADRRHPHPRAPARAERWITRDHGDGCDRLALGREPGTVGRGEGPPLAGPARPEPGRSTTRGRDRGHRSHARRRAREAGRRRPPQCGASGRRGCRGA